ncbi:MAG TPA: HYR domain-containing protein [Thermoanaerobaculia bacterium]|jgi:hypothetical protein
MIKSLAAAVVLFIAAASASAGTITSINPSSFAVNSGEHFITVYGTDLGNRLIFDGPAGHFERDVSAVFTDRVVGWVPEAIIARSGSYTLSVSGPNGTSGPVGFSVKGFTLPLVLLMPEYLRIQPKTREGAYVKYEVMAIGGRDTSYSISCDQQSGSFFKMGITSVNCVVTNLSGERASGSFEVIVRDEVPPVFNFPLEPIVVKAESIEGAVVDYKVTAYDEIWGEAFVDCLPRAGSVFRIGVTNVLCTATDFDENLGIASFPIEVLGDRPYYEFEVIVPETIVVDAESEKGAPAFFKIGTKGTEDRDPRITCTHESGAYFPVGVTTVTCDALDMWGMRGTGSFDVLVVDHGFPAILELYTKPDTLIADNQLYPIDVYVSARDDIDPFPVCEVYDVTSKEDIHLDDFEDPKSYDWLITGPLSLELRAERFNTTRVYNVWVSCTDYYGNRTYTRTPVSVTGGVASRATGAGGGKRRSVR